MKTKEALLKKLGFSDEFINEIENAPIENNYDDSEKGCTCFNAFDTSELDLTSLIVEKTESPINLTAVFITE